MLGSLLLLCIAGLLLFLLLRLFSAIWFLLRFYGYRLERSRDALQVRCGLLTQVSATIPLGRVQFISVHRSLLGRMFGLASIRIETAGGGHEKNEEAATTVGRKWFVPIVDFAEVPRVLRAIDERIRFDDPKIIWNPISKRASSRMIRPVLFVALAVSIAGAFFQPAWGWILGVPIAIGGWAIVRKKSKSRRYARTEWGVIFRSGTLMQKCSMTFFDKIQSVDLSVSPFDRRWSMARLSLDTAASGPADHRICIELLDSELATNEFRAIKQCIQTCTVI